MKPKLLFPTIFCLLLVSSVNSKAQENSRGEYNITSLKQLKDSSHKGRISAFYFEGKQGSFEGMEGVKINYRIFLQTGKEKGAIVISTGRTEAAMKFMEVVFDLYNNGYSVYCFDHRGQGLSGRMTDDHDMGFVDDFQYYIDDMKTLFDKLVRKGNHEKHYLLGHSLGGAIGLSYLEQYPADFDAASFSSPMLGFSAYICPLAKVLSGKTPKYAPGAGSYSDDSTKYETNDVSHCRERYYQKIALNNEYPEARLGGVSIQWVEQSCIHMKRVHKEVAKLQTPVYIFAAGEEMVVNPAGTEKFVAKAKKLKKECNYMVIQGAMHELLMEKDEARSKMLVETLNFFLQN